LTRDPIAYGLDAPDPASHLFRVRCLVPDPDPGGQRFSLPAWTPGSYVIRDFARHVVCVDATSGGAPVDVDKDDKQTWRCAPCDGPLELTLECYAHELSVRAAFLDTTRGFVSGTSLFPRVRGRERRPCTLALERPPGGRYRDWRAATAMTPEDVDGDGFGRYRAADWDELVDHPIELGRFDRAGFEACGVPHGIVLAGRHRADLARLTDDLAALCTHHIRFFGEPAPMERYLFLVTVLSEGYGGLEHRGSSSLMCSRGDLPRAGEQGVRDAYRDFLGLCSHEYFHAWNVKRIQPAALAGADLSREVHTELLWAFEGITSYYDDRALLASGLVDAPVWLELLGRTVTRVLRGAGRFRQSVAESSFDAWTRFYKQDENAPNAIVSYYAKGALVALALDLLIRRDTDGRRSLDDVMRALWERHGRTGEGVPEHGVERVAAEVSGLDLDAFFESALRGRDDLPLEALLADFGVRLHLRPAASADDKGGTPPPEPASGGGRRAALGARIGGTDADPVLEVVHDGAPARRAGLAPGDRLVAVDGLRATRARLPALLDACGAGAAVPVHVFRRDELLRFEVTLGAPPADTAWLELVEDEALTEAGRRRRAEWLQQGPGSDLPDRLTEGEENPVRAG